MPVAALIGVMIAIVVGVSLISPVQEVAQQATSPTTDAITGVVTPAVATGATASLLGILPIIFVAVIILGAISWIGFAGEGGTARRNKVMAAVKALKNPKELMLRFEKSSRAWAEYLNNLDELLGIRTVRAKENSGFGLRLQGSELWIDEGYHWFMADKAQDQDVFKIVGLHKKDAEQNCVYLLGKNNESSQPFLIKLPNPYLDAAYKCSDCITWAKSTSEVYGKAMSVEPTRELVSVRAKYPAGEAKTEPNLFSVDDIIEAERR